MQPMKASFLAGHLLGAALLIPFAPFGASAGLMLLLGVASAPLCVTGFAVGCRNGQPSSVALGNGWKRALGVGLGALGALAALPGTLWLFAALPDTSAWRVLASGGWLMLVGGVAGYACGRRAG